MQFCACVMSLFIMLSYSGDDAVRAADAGDSSTRRRTTTASAIQPTVLVFMIATATAHSNAIEHQRNNSSTNNNSSNLLIGTVTTRSMTNTAMDHRILHYQTMAIIEATVLRICRHVVDSGSRLMAGCSLPVVKEAMSMTIRTGKYDNLSIGSCNSHLITFT